MQSINSNQQYISTSRTVSQQWNQSPALEEAQDKIELLCEQISSLQQYLSEQFQQQQMVEQELRRANEEIELMNKEIQRFFKAKLLFLEEIKKFARRVPASEKTSRKALIDLLNSAYDEAYDEIIPFKELEYVLSSLCFQDYAT